MHQMVFYEEICGKTITLEKKQVFMESNGSKIKSYQKNFEIIVMNREILKY